MSNESDDNDSDDSDYAIESEAESSDDTSEYNSDGIEEVLEDMAHHHTWRPAKALSVRNFRPKLLVI